MAYLTLCVDTDVMMSVSISAQSTVTNVGVNSHVSTSISLEPKQWYINIEHSFFFWVVLFSECLVQTESFVLSWSSFCQFYVISYRLSTTWALLECYLSATWALLECYLSATWVLPRWYLGATWVLLKLSSSTQVALEYYLGATWVLLEYYLYNLFTYY